MAAAELELTDWRRAVSALYADVRAETDPIDGHARWRAGRDQLFREHPQSPLPADDPLRESGLPYWPYDASLRFELDLHEAAGARSTGFSTDPDDRLDIPTGGDEVTVLRRIGRVELPAPLSAGLDVWWLAQYGGGVFLPIRDGSAGHGSYGGGRYLLDTAKSADLGAGRAPGTIVVDLNFAYHPSCRYNPDWVCPLAPPGNTIAPPVHAGERI